MTNEIEARRHFLRNAAASIGIVLSAPAIATIIASCEQDETGPTKTGKTFTVDITTHPELATVGGITSTVITGLNADNPVFISRVSTSACAVFSVVCTHQGCFVELPFQPGQNCFCPCHGSQFSPIDGSVKVQPSSGSATNLPTFASSFDATTNILTITG